MSFLILSLAGHKGLKNRSQLYLFVHKQTRHLVLAYSSMVYAMKQVNFVAEALLGPFLSLSCLYFDCLGRWQFRAHCFGDSNQCCCLECPVNLPNFNFLECLYDPNCLSFKEHTAKADWLALVVESSSLLSWSLNVLINLGCLQPHQWSQWTCSALARGSIERPPDSRNQYSSAHPKLKC